MYEWDKTLPRARTVSKSCSVVFARPYRHCSIHYYVPPAENDKTALDRFLNNLMKSMPKRNEAGFHSKLLNLLLTLISEERYFRINPDTGRLLTQKCGMEEIRKNNSAEIALSAPWFDSTLLCPTSLLGVHFSKSAQPYKPHSIHGNSVNIVQQRCLNNSLRIELIAILYSRKPQGIFLTINYTTTLSASCLLCRSRLTEISCDDAPHKRC